MSSELSPLDLAAGTAGDMTAAIPLSRRLLRSPREQDQETVAAIKRLQRTHNRLRLFFPNCLTSSQDLGMQRKLLYLRRTRFAPFVKDSIRWIYYKKYRLGIVYLLPVKSS